MSSLQVPDPGLLAKLSQCVLDSRSGCKKQHADVQIVCADGIFHWNSLILAASSSFLKNLMESPSFEENERLLIMPDAYLSTLVSLLPKLLLANINEANSREVELLRLLGISEKLRIESKELPTVLIRSSAGPIRDEPIENSNENVSHVFQIKPESDLVVDDVDIVWDEVKKGRGSLRDDVENDYVVENDDNDAENELEEELQSFDIFHGILSSNSNFSKENDDNTFQTRIKHCRKCSLYFTTIEEFLFHQKENPDHFSPKKAREYKCRFCDLDFTKQPFDVYKDHKHSHRNEVGEYPCLFEGCSKAFPTWGHMNDHMYVHGLWDRPHKCSYCDYKTTTKANISKHEMAMHIDPSRRDYVCNQCNKAFKTSSNMYEHMRSHDPKNRFVCEICNKVFKSTPGFTQHMRLHTGQLFECSVCKEKFQSRNSMLRHEKEVHGVFPNPDGTKSYRCKNGCEVEFDNEADYRIHQKTAHESSAVIVCPVCQKIFSNRPSLKQHIKRAHIAMPQQSQLSSPRKSLLKTGDQAEKQNLQHVPIRIVYETPKRKAGLSLLKSHPIENELQAPIPTKLKSRSPLSERCKICKNKFQYRYQVLAHQAIKHYGHFKCIFSGCSLTKDFGSIHHLTRHLRRHTKEKLWSCQCGKSFFSQAKFSQHEAEYVNKFLCPAQNCGRGFCRYDQLDGHWSEHDQNHNVNSWFCPSCSCELGSKEEKEEHCLSEHPPKYIWTCKWCQKKGSGLGGWKVHVNKYCKEKLNISHGRYQGENNLDGFECEICKKMFMSLDYLKRHLKTIHGQENVGVVDTENFGKLLKDKKDCTLCDKSFCSKQSLERHIIAHHNKAAMEFCDICNKLVLDLKTHSKRTHSDIYYPCSYCEKTFQYKTSLKKHINISHQQLRAGVCSLCDKSVLDLNRHLREAHKYETEGEEEITYHLEATGHDDVVVDDGGIVYQVTEGDEQSIALYQMGSTDEDVREVILQPEEVVFQEEVSQDEVVFQVGGVQGDVEMFQSGGQEQVVFQVETRDNDADMIIYNINE